MVRGRRGIEPPAQTLPPNRLYRNHRVSGLLENFARYSAAMLARFRSFGRPPSIGAPIDGVRDFAARRANSPLSVRHQ